jgi:hypothetical protein
MLACKWWQDTTLPHMRHEVARMRHENVECGSVVGVAKQRNHA